MDYEFNILYYINIYKKWWRKIILVVGIAMFLTMIFSLRTSVTYVSTVTVLSTGGGTSMGSLGKFLGISDLSGGYSPESVIISILKSRRMAKDISERFNLAKNPRFRYSINTREITGGLAVDVNGSDPALTEKIANFAVQNLDKINMELDITPNKPMVKVLDSATYGSLQPRQISRKVIVAGIFVFLLTSLLAFFSDYIKKLKSKS